MRFWVYVIAAVALLCWIPTALHCQTFSIPNTGSPGWTVTPPSGPTVSAVIVNPIPAPAWIANTATSQWISVSAFYGIGATGVYAYAAPTFSLSGFDPTTAQCSGQFAADDSATLNFNGPAILATQHGFKDWTSFAITNGFSAGDNAITVLVTNSGSAANATGLRLEIACTALPTTPIAAPPTSGSLTALYVPFTWQPDGSWTGLITNATGDPPVLYFVNGVPAFNFAIVQGQFITGQGWPVTVRPNGTPWPKDVTVMGVVIH